MINASDYPKDKYSAYFEVVTDGDDWVARVYERKTGKMVEGSGKGSPDKWIKAEMAKRKV